MCARWLRRRGLSVGRGERPLSPSEWDGEASGRQVRLPGTADGGGRWFITRQGTLESEATTGDTSVGCPDGCHPSDEQNAHIARRDPARALREVEAKRQIIRCYQEAQRSLVAEGEDALWEAIGFLADAYSDHPDYDKKKKIFL